MYGVNEAIRVIMVNVQKCARMRERAEDEYIKQNDDLFHEGVSPYYEVAVMLLRVISAV